LDCFSKINPKTFQCLTNTGLRPSLEGKHIIDITDWNDHITRSHYK
jgi:hypothetical protein